MRHAPALSRPFPRLPIVIGVAFAFAPPALAQDTVQVAAADAPPVRLEQVLIKGQALRGANAPFSTTTFDAEEVRDKWVSQPQELFRFVPGMNVRNFGLSGVADAFALRGFSGGGHGGDVGIVIDGIPLNEAMSHADGYADLNVVIPLEIASMTVYRGPVSALYGNFNRGGLIAIQTRKGGAYRNADLSLASNTTVDAQAALGTTLAGGSQSLNLAAQVFHTDGFRPQSQFDRGTMAGRWAIDLSPQVQMSLAARLHRGEGDSPAYLTRAQFDVDPTGKDPRAQNDGAEKDFATLRGDLAWQVAPQVRLLAFAYGTQQDFTRWFSRPVSATSWAQREETYDRDVFGAGVNLNGRLAAGAGPLNWVAGIETFRESTAYGFYDGLAQRVRVNPAVYDRTVDLNSASLFAEVEAPLYRLFKPWVGVRHDRFTGNCSRNGAETGTDPCERLNTTRHTSPKLGVRSDVADGVQLRASWAEGFALPSNFIKYSTGAAGLKPNVFRQTEVGGALRSAGIRADVAWYRITSTNEFRTIAPGVYENAGETLRDGIEASLGWTPLADLDLTLTYGRMDSEIRANPNPALVGKKVTGVPDDALTLAVAYAPVAGWGGNVTVRRVGAYAINADNSVTGGAYRTVDLTVTYAGSGALRYRAFLGIDNATDRTYFTSSFISSGTQLVAPAPPRTYRAGVQLDF
jgi:iron complex outermembrane receptor protein